MRGLPVVIQAFHIARAHGKFHMTTGNPRQLMALPAGVTLLASVLLRRLEADGATVKVIDGQQLWVELPRVTAWALRGIRRHRDELRRLVEARDRLM